MRRFFLTVSVLLGLTVPASSQAPNSITSVITNAPPASTPLSGTEIIPVIQGGSLHRTSPGQIVTPVTGDVTPLQFGAVGDGVADDTVAVQAAMDAAAFGTLFLGPHLYAINATGLSCNNQMIISGTNGGAGAIPGTQHSGFVAMVPNMTLFNMTPACIGLLLQDFYIGMDVHGTNTSGWAIQTNTSANFTFERIQIVGSCNGIDASGFYWMIHQVSLLNPHGGANCTGIRVGHTTTGSATTGAISNVNIFSTDTADRLGIGMLFEDAGGFKVSHNDITHPVNGTVIKPGLNQIVTWAFFHDTVLGDTTTDAPLLIDSAHTSATVQGIQCNGCWASSSTTKSGIIIQNTAAIPLSRFTGFYFLGTRVLNNGQNGIVVSSGTDVDVAESHICGNNVLPGGFTGIGVAAGVNNVRIRGGAIGGTCNSRTTTQTNGITFGGSNSNVIVEGVDLSQGNTSAIATGATMAGRFVNNPGYNVTSTFNPTVSASPFSYTAGMTPEVVCVLGGTVAGIQIGSTIMASTTNQCLSLSPNQVMGVSYSVAPTMAVSRL